MGSMSPASEEQGMPELAEESRRSRFETLRGVRWRIDLGILPRDSSFDDLRRAAADRRRRYAGLRRRLLVDPHVSKGGTKSPDLAVDNPLSQNPDSIWGRFFRNAELEKTVDQDLSRLYPEHGSYFQTPGCQGMLRRVLLLWCLSHQEYGYRQGMHELLAPLLYVLHVDLERLSEVRKLYEDLFNDQFDDLSSHENDLTYNFDYKKFLDSLNNETCSQGSSVKFRSLDQLDPEIQAIVLLSDAYGAEGELGIVLSEKFMEHDAYAMFDALMSEAHGSVAMADFFSPVPVTGSNSGLPAVIEASAALYHLLSIVDSSLHSHLVELGVEPQYFALRWLRVLFGREFSLEDLLLIWDELFAADNHKLARSSTDETASTFAIVGTSRGALILGIAVAMILHIRSSLLATENATTCLKRLLNFPENVDLLKLIKKARSLQALALEAGSFSSIDFLDEAINYSKPTLMRRNTLSFDSSSPKSPLSLLPDSYWEEKWRVAQKAEENGHPSSGKQSQPRRKGWLEKVGMNHPLSRTESDPSPAKKIGGSNGRKSVRRSLLEDLSRQLGMDEGIEEASCTSQVDQHPAEASEYISNNDVICTHEERRLSESTGSEENSVFSEATSHLSGGNENDNHSEKSSVASNSNDENDSHSEKSSIASNANDFSEATAEDNLPASHLPNDYPLLISESNKEPAEKVVTSAKERKPLSSKFQWFWKLGRNAAAEGTLERATETSESPQSANEAGDQSNPLGGSCSDVGSCQTCDNGKDGVDQNVTDTLKNLGHSMLEHIQVIESVFQQDRGQMGPLENFSKNVLVGKGQVTAVAALKELRKISNLLSEM